MPRHIGIIKHPTYYTTGYDMHIWQDNDEIRVSWYDFSSDKKEYEFLTPEWTMNKVKNLIKENVEYISTGGGSGRYWILLKIIHIDPS